MRNWEIRQRGIVAAVLTGTLLLLALLASAGNPTQAPAADAESATEAQPAAAPSAARARSGPS